MRGHLGERWQWLEAALAKHDTLSASARAKALSQAGQIAFEQGDYERSIALGEESLALSRKLEDKASAAAALYILAWAAMFWNELERASALTEEALVIQREMNDRAGVARTFLSRGWRRTPDTTTNGL